MTFKLTITLTKKEVEKLRGQKHEIGTLGHALQKRLRGRTITITELRLIAEVAHHVNKTGYLWEEPEPQVQEATA